MTSSRSRLITLSPHNKSRTQNVWLTNLAPDCIAADLGQLRRRRLKQCAKDQSHPKPAAIASSGPQYPMWLLAGLLGLVTFAVYWPVLSHDFINYDDTSYVTSNPRVQTGLTWHNIQWAFCHPVVGNWHPVTMLSHMSDCQLYGLRPWGHHLTNLLLHAANTTLVFLLLLRLTGAPWRSWF